MGIGAVELSPLSGGCVGQVYGVRLADGLNVVVKTDNGSRPSLHIEGYMLRYLKDNSQLPIPKVWYSSPQLLIMSRLAGDSIFNKASQEDAAELLAHLHQVKGPAYGLERATLIGGLHQPNPWTDSWLDFFVEQRLLHMGQVCVHKERFSSEFLARLRRLCEGIGEWLIEPEQPSLIHGDMWTGNILAKGGCITGFVDPAIYYASPEIELAFSTLFGTFGEWFFSRYQEINPIEPGFFEERRDIYNLYPLLVHVRLFGGSYVSSVDRTLRRFGY